MKLKSLSRLLPTWQNALLALLSAVLLILAFPPFEWEFTAALAFFPLFWAVEREGKVGSSFTVGWLFGNIFFFGTCWWLTFAPITYAGFPAPVAYFLLFCVSSTAAVFPGFFTAIIAYMLSRIGAAAFLAVPYVWVFTEFARYWITGNKWNATGYVMAFVLGNEPFLPSYGGVLLCSFYILFKSSSAFYPLLQLVRGRSLKSLIPFFIYSLVVGILLLAASDTQTSIQQDSDGPKSTLVAIQPNVPMAGLTLEKWRELRRRHVQLAETALNKQGQSLAADNRTPTTVVFPESPMNFQYDDDPETREFINNFAAKYNVSVLFNSAEPDKENNKYFNSAVLVGPDGNEIGQYDKIYLLPFGEAVPVPLDSIVPAFVGSFSYGKEYDLLPIGDAKAGVMICFESHFGQLPAEYVRNGADVLIEMTNDGYLGPTPVLRQHLANAVFRAVETNRPVLRVTNVGITAYISERGQVLDPAESYVEDTRVWSVGKSDGSRTIYVKYGDWFAWLCTIITMVLLGTAFISRRAVENRE